jgi:alanyl-tRNA synthetase
MEIGNQVFTQYRREEDGGFSELATKNVDFGGGLERISAAAINSPDVFNGSLLKPIIEKLEKLSKKKYAENTAPFRVIADHLRAATFLATDGVKPSNKEQGYVMRRFIRRAVRFAFDLGVEQNFLDQLVPIITDLYKNDYPEVSEHENEIIETLTKEEKVFRQTLRKGIRELEKIAKSGDEINGENLFTLYDTYGFPVELSTEEAWQKEYQISENWRAEFDAKMAEQRARSQTATKGTFKGGLGGQTWQHRKYHTATHLMLAALRKIVSDDIVQHGSNITEERLRFDFNHEGKVSRDLLDKVEAQVNAWIDEDLPVSFEMYPVKKAFALNAIGSFGERYGEEVKVYKMGNYDAGDPRNASFEICGGPHVDHTGQLKEPKNEDGSGVETDHEKRFKIKKEEASSSGIRRIKAVLE